MTGRLRIACSLIALVGVAGAPRLARANDPATAQALFDQARKLMTEQRWSEACPKLEESQRLDPGGGTLLHLALCREHEGRTATAWALYQTALAQAKRDARKDRAKIAQARIDALGPRLPRMRVKVARENQSLEGFRVTRDETPVGKAQWGEAIPVDPGTRSIVAQAEGRRTFSAKIEVPKGPGETVVEIPELEPDTSEPASTPPPPSSSAAPTSSPRPRGHDGAASAERPPKTTPIEAAHRGETQRTIGLAVGGAGAIGLVVGSIFGLVSISKKSEADGECRPPDHVLCSAKGVEAADDAIAAGNVSTIAFVAGALLAGGGAALYFTAPKAGASVGLAPSPRGASLALTGRFW